MYRQGPQWPRGHDFGNDRRALGTDRTEGSCAGLRSLGPPPPTRGIFGPALPLRLATQGVAAGIEAEADVGEAVVPVHEDGAVDGQAGGVGEALVPGSPRMLLDTRGRGAYDARCSIDEPPLRRNEQLCG